MTEYVRGLWLGGGISRKALEEVIRAIEYHLELDQAFCKLPDSVKMELENLANAAHADLTKMPVPKPVCDLI